MKKKKSVNIVIDPMTMKRVDADTGEEIVSKDDKNKKKGQSNNNMM